MAKFTPFDVRSTQCQQQAGGNPMGIPIRDALNLYSSVPGGGWSADFLASSDSRIQSGSRLRSRIATIVTHSPASV